jgi:thiamine transport system substrate-binding protein
MRASIILAVLSVIVIVGLAACGPASAPAPTPSPTVAATPQPAGPARLVVMTHDSFNASEGVIAEFESANNVKVEFLKSGDAGSALNQAILSKDNPLADLFYGVDNTFFSRAIGAGIFEPYQAKGLENVPARFQLDPQGRLTPVDYGDVCLNYDKKYFQEKGLAPPQKLEDLVKPEYKGLLVVENPATSSPGLSFLLASVGHFGESGYLDFWRQSRDNDVLVSNGWEDAYYGQFSGGSGKGTRPLVVSYATSPAAEVYFSEGKLSEPPTGNVLGDGACFRQIEFVGILKGTKNRALAEKFIDFMVGVSFQEDIPLQMFVFPVNEKAKLPEVFVKFAEVPQKPAEVAAEDIGKNREAWIEKWTETVLR